MTKIYYTFTTFILLFVGIQSKAASKSVEFKAAIPVFSDTFDDIMGEGGNDGVWTTKNAKSLNLKRSNVELSYCSEANMCVCVGASYAGDITISGIPDARFFITFRAGAFADDNDSSVPINIQAKDKTSITVKPNSFSNVRKTFTGTNSNSKIVIKGNDEKDNFKFFLDDLTIYALTSDIDALKSATRIILNIDTCTSEQIEVLKEIVNENKNLTSLDLWSATINEKITFEPANPNCIFYDPNNVVENTNNVVRLSGTKKDVNQYVCENLVICEGYPFAAMFGFTAENVSYDRAFASTGADYFSTVCLPFTINSEALNNCRLLKFVKHVAEQNCIIIEDATELTANTPYVITVDTKQPFLNLQGVNVKVEAGSPRMVWEQVEASSTSSEKEQSKRFRMCGTFETITDKETNDKQTIYGFSEGKFVKVGSDCTFNPFRVYLALDNSSTALSAKEFRLITKSGTVGISPVKAQYTTKVSRIYSLDGTYTDKGSFNYLPKGIYIINGKKALVK